MLMNPPYKISKENTYKILTSVGLILVIAAGLAIGATNFAQIPESAKNLLASVISVSSELKRAEGIEVTTPALNLTSGEKTLITWNHIGKTTDGSYRIYYPCRKDFYLEIISAENKGALVFCNVPQDFLNQNDSVAIIPHSNGNRYLDIPLTVEFVRNGEDEVSVFGTSLLTIFNEKVAASPSVLEVTGEAKDEIAKTKEGDAVNKENQASASDGLNAPTSNTAPKNKTTGEKKETTVLISGNIGASSGPAGKPDLAAKILAIGKIDIANNNAFIATTTLKSTDRIAVRFEVVNLGTKTSESWHFNAVLPTFPMYIFTSEMQTVLAPNDKIIFTLGFDKIEKKDGNIVTINVDPTGYPPDVTRDNNIVKVTIDGIQF